ncbi:MAG TPA: MaoC/PaaZ C-terminal domain-containing protein [Solirubrobacteraceae bacterium]|nr:MaoC/PaaZ C-terminal domain-containing protein [Solirubrobacteraceae bacterium]
MAATTYGKIAVGAALGPLRRRPDAVPERELHRDGIVVDRRQLAAYDRVCGFRLSDTLPATYPHVLAFPLAMELMASGSFPFGVLGLVHVGNAVEQLRPLDAGEPLDLRVWAERLAEHPRGRTVDIVAETYAGGELAWRDRSTYLHRESDGGGKAATKERAEPREPVAEWEVPGDTGRRYAAVSGDRNPIHMHGLAAKLFGQRAAIAHGMWTKARCLAALQGHLPAAFTVEVAFKLPVLLPAKVAFSSWTDGDVRRVALHDARSGRPHLEGKVSPSASATA